MRAKLEELIVTEEEIEEVSGIEINDPILGLLYHPKLWHDRQKFIAFLVSHLLAIALMFMLCTPISLSLVRYLGFSGNDMGSGLTFVAINGAIVATIAGFINIYLWKKSRKLTNFFRFLEELEKYNQVIRSIDAIDRIEAAGNTGVQVRDRAEVLAALQVTRDSLIGSLRTERILREHRGLLERRYELFASIESNLATLRGLEISDEVSEYGRLLNQALQIGLSVDREVRRLKN
jgi:hypothetical protein